VVEIKLTATSDHNIVFELTASITDSDKIVTTRGQKGIEGCIDGSEMPGALK
jgi:hypothetical protein